MYNHHHIVEASHMLQRRIQIARSGTKRYKGSPEQICKKIIDQCWNGTFFQVSTGHFSIFYMRDFGMCIDALLKLGYKRQVMDTLHFALVVYSRQEECTTTINAKGKGFNVFSYAPDTLAFLLYSLRKANAKDLIEIYKPFLEEQIQFFKTNYLQSNGLIKEDINVSSIKDNAKRSSSCYDNTCAAVIAREASLLKLKNPLKKYNYQKLLKKHFWNGNYFIDTKEEDEVTGDANTYPYWFEIFTDKKMIKSSIKHIRAAELDKPFPLKYTGFIPDNWIFPLSLFAYNYEGNTIWAHMGLCYIDVVNKVDKTLANKYRKAYKEQITKHKNFLELYNEKGKPYKTPFYHADESMLWASKWLALTL